MPDDGAPYRFLLHLARSDSDDERCRVTLEVGEMPLGIGSHIFNASSTSSVIHLLPSGFDADGTGPRLMTPSSRMRATSLSALEPGMDRVPHDRAPVPSKKPSPQEALSHGLPGPLRRMRTAQELRWRCAFCECPIVRKVYQPPKGSGGDSFRSGRQRLRDDGHGPQTGPSSTGWPTRRQLS